jgi:hypothetical protein
MFSVMLHSRQRIASVLAMKWFLNDFQSAKNAENGWFLATN